MAQPVSSNAEESTDSLAALALPAPGVAKLNENENPVGPSPAAKRAIEESASYGSRYIGKNFARLKAMIAERHGLTTDHVSLSAGSSGVLTQLTVAASRDGHILIPELFWDTTCKAAERQGATLVRVPMTPDLQIDIDAMLTRINDETGLVQVTNPNNPTGLLLKPARLRQFCISASQKTIVLVDEAYNEITEDPDGNSMVDLVRDGHSVAISRTFSKIYGLAGMRIGYMISTPEIIEKQEQYDIANYVMNQAGISAALACYEDENFVQRSRQEILEARLIVEDGLKANGLDYIPSHTNFIFVNLGTLNAEKFRVAMKERGVLISGIYRDYTHNSRVSMGELSDVAKYVENLPKVLDALNQ